MASPASGKRHRAGSSADPSRAAYSTNPDWDNNFRNPANGVRFAARFDLLS
jgi:hypothetical protein